MAPRLLVFVVSVEALALAQTGPVYLTGKIAMADGTHRLVFAQRPQPRGAKKDAIERDAPQE